ncbi:protein of unknown function [Clostridium beijerinckii]|nr:protein of unknown function [Clostridium beijerinckii]
MEALPRKQKIFKILMKILMKILNNNTEFPNIKKYRIKKKERNTC